MKQALALCIAISASLWATSSAPAGEPAAKVFINGAPSAVFFNDGDSFRVLKGRYKGSKARLAGFNTLESHGPVHQWGTWTAKELYYIAKMATLHARNGVWNCETDGKTDTYGRMLLWCPDLAESQVRHGFAHAMTVTDEPAKEKLLEAQKEAIAARRGIWAHGVPEVVLTSLHSVEEDTTGRGTYNRLVSSADGHSIKWRHENKYSECSRICLMRYPEDAAAIPGLVTKLKQESAELVKGVSDETLSAVLSTYQRLRRIDRPFPSERRDKLQSLLDSWTAQGAFPQEPEGEVSCMIHVDFKRRYGTGRAKCLK
jgi:endonuclease YncB( thermonuclease family)